jgi:Ulp1 family protease
MTVDTESQKWLLPKTDDNTTIRDHWINQDIIDGYGHLLMTKQSQTSGAGNCGDRILPTGTGDAIMQFYDNENNWTTHRRIEERGKLQRVRRQQATRRAAKILLPVLINDDHWILVVINAAARTTRTYDPLGGDQTARARQITKWWTDMDWDPTEEDGDDGDNRQWQIHRDKMPLQKNEDGTTNTTDCGVLVCAAMRRLMLNPNRPRTAEDWGFRGKEGTRWRFKLIHELNANKIITNNTT